MTGFAIGVADELVTGQTILEQVGLADGSHSSNPTLFTALLALMLVPTGAATVNTMFKVASGAMTVKQLKGYAKFFGLDSEQDAKMASTMRTLAKLEGIEDDATLTLDDATAMNAAPLSPWLS